MNFDYNFLATYFQEKTDDEYIWGTTMYAYYLLEWDEVHVLSNLGPWFLFLFFAIHYELKNKN